MAESFHRVCQTNDLEEGDLRGVIVAGWPVLISRSNGAVCAVIDKCTHAASELSTGRVRRGAVMCPLHGARFELTTGRCIGGTYKALKTFQSRESDGWIEIALPDGEPGPEYLPVRASA